MAFVTGNRDSFENAAIEHILDLKHGLRYLKHKNDGVGLLKRIGMTGFTAKSVKHEWNEVALAARSETVTIGEEAGHTTLTVADAYIYQVNDLIRIEAEILRVTAIAGSTTLTVTRGYAGTDRVAHTSKEAILLGSADPENSDAPAGRTDQQTRVFNYVQTSTTSVDLSMDELMTRNVEGNPLKGQLKRRTIEWYQRFAQNMFYGVRSEDSGNKIRTMGGLAHYITTNVTDASGGLSLALIDAEIKDIVDAGADPKVMVMGTKQKQALDALDANIVRIGKKTRLGGNPDTQTWQSGILDHTVDVFVDPTVQDDQLWLIDTDYIKLGYLSGNGETGSLSVRDASTPGKDGKKSVIRGKYTMEVENERAHAYLHGLT